jgi:hypothetical protein
MVLFLAGCGFRALGKQDMGGHGDGSSPNGNSGGNGNGGGGGQPGGMPSSDMSAGGGGGGGFDMSGRDMAAADNSCPLPQLIITVADGSSDHHSGGELVRLPLDGSKSSCTTLRGQGLLGPDLVASTYLKQGLIATGDGYSNTIYVVDVNADLIMWKKQPNLATLGQVFDAFPMQDGSGNEAFAMAFVQDGPVFGELRSWYSNGTEVATSPWCLSSYIQCSGTNLMLSNNIAGVAANPITPSHFLAVDGTNHVAGLDVNPLLPNSKTLIPGNNTDHLGAMYAIPVNGKLRVAWLNYNRIGTTPPAVNYYTDTGGSPMVNGPLVCRSSVCPKFSRVVPDPTSATAFFLLCGDESMPNNKVVMHLQNDGTCTTVFDGTTLASNFELTHLAIAQ